MNQKYPLFSCFCIHFKRIIYFLYLQAIDPDSGENAHLSYYMDGTVRETLTEGLDTLRREPFTVALNTGVIKLNFDPQKGMKGYFDFKVSLS